MYIGPEGVLTGSARESQKLMEETGHELHTNAVSRKDREVLRKRKLLEAKIESLKTEFESAEEELNKIYIEDEIKRAVSNKTRQQMTNLRSGNKDI